MNSKNQTSSLSSSLGSNRLQHRPLLGVMLMVTGLALYPLADAFVKHLLHTYSLYQANFLRSFMRLIPLLITTCFYGGPLAFLKTQHPKQHLVRLVVSFVYTLCFMQAFSKDSLTLIYTLSYTSPFFMILLSAWILKEKISYERVLAVVIGMVGVIVAVPSHVNWWQSAALLVLAATFLGALNKILMRKLTSTEHSLTIAIYPNIVMMLFMTPMLLRVGWQTMPWLHWGAFAFLGLLTAVGQYAIAQALRFAQGSILAPIDYSTFFWVVLLDYFWWGKSVDFCTCTGALLIVGSNLYILACSRKEEAKKASIAT